MDSIKQVKHDDYTVLFYEQDTIKDDQYFFTLRQTQNGSFISDDSILELWRDSLQEMSWVNPNLDFKYALEIYEQKDGYFRSIAPVILCNNDSFNTEDVKKLFKSLKTPIEKEVVMSNDYTKEFGKILKEHGFIKQFIGGGCSMKL